MAATSLRASSISSSFETGEIAKRQLFERRSPDPVRHLHVRLLIVGLWRSRANGASTMQLLRRVGPVSGVGLPHARQYDPSPEESHKFLMEDSPLIR